MKSRKSSIDNSTPTNTPKPEPTREQLEQRYANQMSVLCNEAEAVRERYTTLNQKVVEALAGGAQFGQLIADRGRQLIEAETIYRLYMPLLRLFFALVDEETFPDKDAVEAAQASRSVFSSESRRDQIARLRQVAELINQRREQQLRLERSTCWLTNSISQVRVAALLNKFDHGNQTLGNLQSLLQRMEDVSNQIDALSTESVTLREMVKTGQVYNTVEFGPVRVLLSLGALNEISIDYVSEAGDIVKRYSQREADTRINIRSAQ